MNAMQSLLNDASDDLRELLDSALSVQEMRDILENESGDLDNIADSRVPVYNGELLELAMSDHELATVVPELGPAFNGEPTAVNIIASNVYEAILNHVHAKADEALEQLDAYGIDEDALSFTDPNGSEHVLQDAEELYLAVYEALTTDVSF